MSNYSGLAWLVIIGIILLGVFGYWAFTQHDLVVEVETVRDRLGYGGETKSIAVGVVDGEKRIIQFSSPWFIWVNTDKLYLEAVDAMENDETFTAKYHCYGWSIEAWQWYSTCYEKLPLV